MIPINLLLRLVGFLGMCSSLAIYPFSEYARSSENKQEIQVIQWHLAAVSQTVVAAGRCVCHTELPAHLC